MGFFSKLKEKFTQQVDKVTEIVSEKVNSVVEKAAETLKIDKLKEGLSKTRKSFVDKFKLVLGAGRKIDDKLLEEIDYCRYWC